MQLHQILMILFFLLPTRAVTGIYEQRGLIDTLFFIASQFNYKMGSGSSAGPTNSITQEQLDAYKSSIENGLSQRRLKLDHQSNIYPKCQYLLAHYAEYCQEFDELHLTHNMISVECMQLVGKMGLGNLKALVLSNNDINCSAIRNIKHMPLRTLQYLFLDNNLISNDGCYYLSQATLQNLLTLDLNNNLIEDEGCKNLARSSLANLRTLLINKNKYTQKGLVYLSKGEWPLLAFIQAKQNKFEPTKDLEKLKFRSETKVFRLQIQ